jgi:hypothetical protein
LTPPTTTAGARATTRRGTRRSSSSRRGRRSFACLARPMSLEKPRSAMAHGVRAPMLSSGHDSHLNRRTFRRTSELSGAPLVPAWWRSRERAFRKCCRRHGSPSWFHGPVSRKGALERGKRDAKSGGFRRSKERVPSKGANTLPKGLRKGPPQETPKYESSRCVVTGLTKETWRQGNLAKRDLERPRRETDATVWTTTP